MYMDLLYYDNASRIDLRSKDIMYNASARADRVRHITKHMSPKVEKPGDWGLLHNHQINELFVQKMEQMKGLQRKTVISTAFELLEGKSPKKLYSSI